MIGLGSNRLSVCRRGGMSVTQAGRGGMEWLAGNGKRRESPYSDLATAALKAQFSLEQWATIRDYGFAHPEIVGYMNAYAPEDAKIAISLVPTLGLVRAWVTNGDCCIDNGFIPNSNYERVIFDFYLNQSNASGNIIGSYSGTRVGFTIYSAGTSNNSFIWETAQTYSSTRYTFVQGTKYSVDMLADNGTRTVKVNGETIVSGSYSGTVKDCFSHSYFASHNQQGIRPSNKGGICRIVEWMAADNQYSELYPFIRKINGVNVCGMIDLITGTFRQSAAGSGTPTIVEFTPSPS